MPKTVNILIADDHSIVRTGLKTLLESQSHFNVVSEAKNGIEAIQKAKDCNPHIVVLDIRMSGISGIEACRQIVKSVAGCKVIMLTAYAEEALLLSAIQAGAAGFVLKRISNNELIHAIEHVNDGQGYLDSSMISTAFNHIHEAIDIQYPDHFSDLTTQEVTVLSLLPKGMTNRQIAVELNLSEGTIRNYVSNVLGKISVKNRAGAAAFAIRHNIDEVIKN